ncbi:unnamed protein product [Gongylonema pulchrum]|uniref:CACTA en-spm transposon protein n=1 Tax=Gongylonema pulchrum TaxID=637853 RepID=A0A183DNE3_9BILA|nr:unnamed protein product [Gongylonema pulchrum]
MVVTKELEVAQSLDDADSSWSEGDRSVDRFVPVLSSFLSTAKKDFEQTEKQFDDMNVNGGFVLGGVDIDDDRYFAASSFI